MGIKQFLSVLIAAGLTVASASSYAVDVYQRRTTAITPLTIAAATLTPIIQITVPAGTWRVIAKASVVNFGASNYLRCVVRSGATQIDSATTMVGEAGGQPAVATLTNVGLITTGLTTVFSLQCLHDFGANGIYVDPDAKLNVERVSSGFISN
jgi:hypothetical protein